METMRAFVTAVWSDLLIVSYAVPEAILVPWVPPGLTLDRWQGQSYVSLVAFRFRRTRVLGLGMPRGMTLTDFPQWNLRLYVKSGGSDGGVERGIVFVQEYVPSPFIAAAVHALYNEPYLSAPLTCRATTVGDLRRVRYDLDVGGGRHTLAVTGRGPTYRPEPGSAEAFFTGQGWGNGRDRSGRATRFRVTHPLWRVYDVVDTHLSVDFGRLYGPVWAFLQGRVPDVTVLCEGSFVHVSPRLRG